MANIETICISPELFHLVIDDNNRYIYNENKILLQRKEDGQLIYAELKIAQEVFNLYFLPNENEDCIRNSWCRNDILFLINLYKEHEQDFKSTSVKNDKVWKIITTKLGNHTIEQVKNKFKYLKQKYVSKKDNMRSTQSGVKSIYFEYYSEMDKIFGKDANIVPKFIASSMKGKENVQHFNIENTEEPIPTTSTSALSTVPIIPKKKTKSLIQLENLSENLKKKEESKQARHDKKQQNIENFVVALNKLSSSLDKFSDSIEKFSNVILTNTNLK